MTNYLSLSLMVFTYCVILASLIDVFAAQKIGWLDGKRCVAKMLNYATEMAI